MKVQVEDISSVEKRLSIEVDHALVEQELSQAYAQLSRKVRLPGFRPGKVPRRILEQRYRAEVEADVVKRVQLRAFLDAVMQHNVAAVGDPQLTGGAIASGQPFAFTARVEVKPDIALTQVKGLTLKRFSTDVPDERIDEQLERLRQSRSSVEKVEGRTEAKLGDLALIDFDATRDGQPFPGSSSRDVTVEVAEGQLVEGNLPQLEGATVGQVKTFDYTFPADYRVDAVKGQTAQFSVTLKELRERRVPALDDAFARSLGVDDLAALRAKVREDLERSAKRAAAIDERNDVFQKLIEKNDFEVPNALVERGIEIMLEGAFGQMQRQGFDFRNMNLDWAKLREEMRPRSVTEVRGQLLLEAITTQEKLEVTQADLDAECEAVSQETGMPVAAVRAQFKGAQGQDNLKGRALERKAIDFVKAHATFE